MGVNYGVCILLFPLLSLFYYWDEPRLEKTVQNKLHTHAQNAVPFPLKIYTCSSLVPRASTFWIKGDQMCDTLDQNQKILVSV